MKFPEWSPESLVKLYIKNIEIDSKDEKLERFTPEIEIARMRKDEKYKTYNEEQFKQIYEKLYRQGLGFLPTEESHALLLKLISDLRMKVVWESLARRKKTDNDSFKFWLACNRAVGGWRGEPKITEKEKLQILINIQNSITSLRSSMYKLREFEHYSINALIDNQSIEGLLGTLNADLSIIEENKRVDCASFCLSDIMPNIDFVLMDIHTKAKDYMNVSVTVKKPNSENAQTHYFVRQISKFFQSYFGQPLHESVAIVTSVTLGIEEIDSDYVRKLVKI